MARSLPGSIKGFTMASMLCMSMSLNSVFPGVHSNAIGVALARRSTWFARGAPSYGARTSSVVSKPLSVSKHVVGKDRVPAYTVCGAKPNKGSSEEFNSTPIEGVYVLMLSNRTYYVGKSVNIPERVKQHMSGKGASCVRGPVTRISPITPRQCDLESWERTETLTRMYKYGICKVSVGCVFVMSV